jgi:hypothetical protein
MAAPREEQIRCVLAPTEGPLDPSPELTPEAALDPAPASSPDLVAVTLQMRE